MEGAVWAKARGLGWLRWAGQTTSPVGAQAHGAGPAVMWGARMESLGCQELTQLCSSSPSSSLRVLLCSLVST